MQSRAASSCLFGHQFVKIFRHPLQGETHAEERWTWVAGRTRHCACVSAGGEAAGAAGG